MSCPMPHFVLFSSADRGTDHQAGRWSFRLEEQDGASRLDAEEVEPRVRGERLELLAVVRGLEALEEPSAVTLVTDSRYVLRGLTDGLDEWRANGWRWEAFGDMVPVKNRDLWQRVDRALAYHKVHCRRAMRHRAEHGVPAPHFRLKTSPRPAVSSQRTDRTLTKHDHGTGFRFGRLLAWLAARLRWRSMEYRSC